jgi:hypothetical protein
VAYARDRGRERERERDRARGRGVTAVAAAAAQEGEERHARGCNNRSQCQHSGMLIIGRYLASPPPSLSLSRSPVVGAAVAQRRVAKCLSREFNLIERVSRTFFPTRSRPPLPAARWAFKILDVPRRQRGNSRASLGKSGASRVGGCRGTACPRPSSAWLGSSSGINRRDGDGADLRLGANGEFPGGRVNNDGWRCLADVPTGDRRVAHDLMHTGGRRPRISSTASEAPP